MTRPMLAAELAQEIGKHRPSLELYRWDDFYAMPVRYKAVEVTLFLVERPGEDEPLWDRVRPDPEEGKILSTKTVLMLEIVNE